jgi:alkylation response protein AidB-like acyl-CoA dehydrogenase
MNFDFSEEQGMLRDSVARFVQDDYDFDARRAIVATRCGHEPRELGRPSPSSVG